MMKASMQASARADEDIIVFGPFQLDRIRHELRKDGACLAVGSRAIGILIALTRHPGKTVSSRELLREVWRDTVVEEGTVRVHVALLRKILRDADPDNEYVQNVTGRGYRFVMPVLRSTNTKLPAGRRLGNNLPQRLTSIIGREAVIDVLAEKVTGQRLVTIVGPGGGGKSTVAIGVAQALAESLLSDVYFVDLASIEDNRLVANALASVLGVVPVAPDPLPEVLASLCDRSMLLVLDNCEHIVDAAAELAERVLQSAPGVHILATSREPLRTMGESIVELAPLAVPSEQTQHTRAQLLECPAIQLFVQRAEAHARVQFDDEDVQLVADICRRLGGNPLAIEIAAGQVRFLGLRMLSVSLDDHLLLSIDGRRTAAPRHQSLRATLDWSYGLLTPAEQVSFRRLSVFASRFDLDCAIAVLADGELSEATAFECLVSLTRKSLVLAETRGGSVSYRLLDLPRAYAREKLEASGEQDAVRHRHARMWCSIGARQIHAHVRRGEQWVSAFGERLEDLRGAIRWSFAPESSSPLATKLVLTSLWFECVLAGESSGELEWVELYRYILGGAEGVLLAGLEDILENSRRCMEVPVLELTVLQHIARGHAESKTALWSLWFERVIKRDYRIAINLANAARACDFQTSAHEGPLVDRMLAVAYHYAGEQVLACKHAQRALDAAPSESASEQMQALLRCHMRSILARALWVRGFPDQALEAAHLSIAEAQHAGSPRLLCLTLLIGVAVAIWCGNSIAARSLRERLHEQAALHSMEYHRLWADCLQTIMAPQGLQGQEPLQLSADPLSSSQYLDVLGTLREELVSTDAITRTEAGRGGWVTAEVLRVKAERLIRDHGPASYACAEVLMHRALECARHQGARAWELRIAMSLARLWQKQERVQQGRALLHAVYSGFTEGYETADLVAARELIGQLTALDA
jgi:predicted ATPase/DNA-binding winged helix-turn-helix (wHTH) protein